MTITKKLLALCEAGEAPGQLELVKTDLATARAFAEKVFKEAGRDLDKEIPNFDKNYTLAKKVASAGWTARKDMPVIEIEQVKEFQKRLASGYIDVAAPFLDKTKENPFPDGLSGEQAKQWLKNGLSDKVVPDDRIKVIELLVHAKDLKPIQQQIYFDKSITATAEFGAQGTKGFIEKKSLSVASKDNFIIDGHHRWLSALLIDPDMIIRGVQVDMPITKLLPLCLSYSDAIGNKRNEGKSKVGWSITDANDKTVFGPVENESEARKKLKELGGDSKGFNLGYTSDYASKRADESTPAGKLLAMVDDAKAYVANLKKHEGLETPAERLTALVEATPKAEKRYKIFVKKSGGQYGGGGEPSEREGGEGTLAELIDYYKGTLDKGYSYQHEKGNKKINMKPANITSLINNITNAMDNAAANGYSGRSYRFEEIK